MYRALITFCGIVSMHKGQEKDLSNVDKNVIKDLLDSKYIEEIKTKKK